MLTICGCCWSLSLCCVILVTFCFGACEVLDCPTLPLVGAVVDLAVVVVVVVVVDVKFEADAVDLALLIRFFDALLTADCSFPPADPPFTSPPTCLPDLGAELLAFVLVLGLVSLPLVCCCCTIFCVFLPPDVACCCCCCCTNLSLLRVFFAVEFADLVCDRDCCCCLVFPISLPVLTAAARRASSLMESNCLFAASLLPFVVSLLLLLPLIDSTSPFVSLAAVVVDVDPSLLEPLVEDPLPFTGVVSSLDNPVVVIGDDDDEELVVDDDDDDDDGLVVELPSPSVTDGRLAVD